MSATLGDTAFFEEELTKRNGRPTVTVASIDRPVPLEHAYSELPLAKTIESLRSEEHTSELQSLAYLVCRLLLEKKKKKRKTQNTVKIDITDTTDETL